MSERTEKYIENLSRLIKKETISYYDDVDPDLTKFYEFHDLLKEVFPNISAACEWEVFDGSLLLTWKGKDEKADPVMFMNHHDVVEAGGEWEHDPFCGEVYDGKLWGRGTIDTKGGLWAMLQAADELAAEGFVPPVDVYFESACNEETSGHGADMISTALKERGIRLRASFDEGGMIMYDPIGGCDGTFAMVGLGEKGCCDLKFIARSNGGHASAPGKDTPLVRLGKFMAEVEAKNPFEAKISPVNAEMFRRIAPYMGKVGKIIGKPEVFGGIIKAVMSRMPGVAGSMLQTTLAFTRAQGSEGNNVLPQEAWVIGNMRFSHHEGREGSIKKIKPIAEKYNIEIEILDPGDPSGLADPRCDAFKLIEEACAAVLPQVDRVVPYVMTGASDSRYMDRICDQCIRFLPFTITDEQMGSIHGLNECVDVDNLEPAVDFYKYLMQHI